MAGRLNLVKLRIRVGVRSVEVVYKELEIDFNSELVLA